MSDEQILRRREYHRSWYAANKDEQRLKDRERRKLYRAKPGVREAQTAYNREWRDNNRDRVNAAHRRYKQNNLEKRRESYRRSSMKRRYGITPEQKEEIFENQGRRCAACQADEPGGERGWHVDHCHDSGKVRGILCCNCNVALGHAKDDTDRLHSLIEYLEKNS